MTRPTILALVILCSCGPWPDTSGVPLARQDQPWPQLLPLDPILDPAGPPPTSDAEARALSARAAALRMRAAVLRRPVEDDAAMEALRARLSG
jgi:hypothetical protein